LFSFAGGASVSRCSWWRWRSSPPSLSPVSYLGLHYLSDDIAGFLIGAAWALIVRYALTGLEARFEPVPS